MNQSIRNPGRQNHIVRCACDKLCCQAEYDSNLGVAILTLKSSHSSLFLVYPPHPPTMICQS